MIIYMSEGSPRIFILIYIKNDAYFLFLNMLQIMAIRLLNDIYFCIDSHFGGHDVNKNSSTMLQKFYLNYQYIVNITQLLKKTTTKKKHVFIMINRTSEEKTPTHHPLFKKINKYTVGNLKTALKTSENFLGEILSQNHIHIILFLGHYRESYSTFVLGGRDKKARFNIDIINRRHEMSVIFRFGF